jgi:S-adenosylmethionine:tRNA ribosyltransferase-isomerase
MTAFDTFAYDYDLPREQIAQHPAVPRDSARLLVLDRATGRLAHAVFRDIGRFLRAGDLLVVNNTRVFPARTVGERHTGGKVEVFFLREVAANQWEVLVRCGGNPRPGEFILLEDERLSVRLLERTREGHWRVSLKPGVNLLETLDKLGRVPLPPYIKRPAEHQRDAADRARYQTVYARSVGAVAAPTAGLHFTTELLDRLRGQGVETAQVTLHVGPGTFRPITSKDVREHRIHAEYYEIAEAAAEAVNRARQDGRRVIAVGTTTCRALESAAEEGRLRSIAGRTDLFIHPPYTFGLVDGMVTNFHLPRSSLLVMIAAFAGRERVLRAYESARAEGYRFYSYGDAMLIL